jgi:hypothetical protein
MRSSFNLYIYPSYFCSRLRAAGGKETETGNVIQEVRYGLQPSLFETRDGQNSMATGTQLGPNQPASNRPKRSDAA